MTTKHEVIAAHEAHPDWTISDVARHLGCVPQYVTATARRNGLTFVKHQSKMRKVLHITNPTAAAFMGPAEARGVKVHELAKLLLERIASDKLVDAILDDGVTA